jgi:hypothetical protein
MSRDASARIRGGGILAYIMRRGNEHESSSSAGESEKSGSSSSGDGESSHSKRSTEESGSSSSGDEDESDDQRSIEGSEGSADEDGEGDHPKPGSGMEVGGNDGAPPKPKRAPKVAGPVKLHHLGPRTKCKWCPAMLWPGEKKGMSKCCGDGKYVLGAEYNPPIDEEYLALMKLPYFSYNSRFLNDKLCFTAHGTFPSRQDGGLGWHDMGVPAFVHLYGKAYTVFHDPHAGPSFLDSYQLGSQFVYVGAKHDLGVDFAEERPPPPLLLTTPAMGAMGLCVSVGGCRSHGMMRVGVGVGM